MKVILFVLSIFLLNGAFAMSEVENIQFPTFDKLKLNAQLFIPDSTNEKLPVRIPIQLTTNSYSN